MFNFIDSKTLNELPGKLKKMHEDLMQTKRNMKEAVEKDKVLFLGGTGAGKSTFLNYLNGAKYKVGYTPAGKPKADCIFGEEIAKIGHGMVSQTLHPQIVQKANCDFAYCDLAGLFDTRGENERVYAANTLQIIKETKGDIRGILVFLDLPSFNATRGAGFKNIAIALAQITKKNTHLMDSVYFIITKTPNGMSISAKDVIENYVKELLENLLEKDKKELQEEDKALLFMLQQMEKRTANILIPNIADDGRSRKEVEDKLKLLKSKNMNQYNFNGFDKEQIKFKELLQKIAKEYIETKKNTEVIYPGQLKLECEKQYILFEKINNNKLLDKKMTAAISECNDKLNIINQSISKANNTLTYNTRRLKSMCNHPCQTCEGIRALINKTTPESTAIIINEEKNKAELKIQRIILEKDKDAVLKTIEEQEKEMKTLTKKIDSLGDEIKKNAEELKKHQPLFETINNIANLLDLVKDKTIMQFKKVFAQQKTMLNQFVNQGNSGNKNKPNISKHVQNKIKSLNLI